jgi:hypothetical protein
MGRDVLLTKKQNKSPEQIQPEDNFSFEEKEQENPR